ncbi:hypothetical protein NL529_27945, partial [Klebsiella pneumoniae]|nr:hypothetical protein [Klebsiella pneumoniae]
PSNISQINKTELIYYGGLNEVLFSTNNEYNINSTIPCYIYPNQSISLIENKLLHYRTSETYQILSVIFGFLWMATSFACFCMMCEVEQKKCN